MPDTHRLYAITHSLYSGRARSYLIKHQVPFRELSTGHESFKAEVYVPMRTPRWLWGGRRDVRHPSIRLRVATPPAEPGVRPRIDLSAAMYTAAQLANFQAHEQTQPRSLRALDLRARDLTRLDRDAFVRELAAFVRDTGTARFTTPAT